MISFQDMASNINLHAEPGFKYKLTCRTIFVIFLLSDWIAHKAIQIGLTWKFTFQVINKTTKNLIKQTRIFSSYIFELYENKYLLQNIIFRALHLLRW